jgi:hypothetical protein
MCTELQLKRLYDLLVFDRAGNERFGALLHGIAQLSLAIARKLASDSRAFSARFHIVAVF